MGMDAFTDLTQGFLSMFETGGEILLGWMTTILPMVVCLMTAVSAIVKLIRKDYQIFDPLAHCTLYAFTADGNLISWKSALLHIWKISG